MALKTIASKVKDTREKHGRSFWVRLLHKFKHYFTQRREAFQKQIGRRTQKEITLYQKLFFWCGCLLVGICLAILGYEYIASPDIKLAPIKLEERCSSLEQQVDNFIGEANYCQTSDDCLVWEPQELICPFGCYFLINQKTNISNRAIQKSIIAGLRKFQKSCPLCLYKCPVIPQKTDLICLNNKCLDRRFYSQNAGILPQGEQALFGPEQKTDTDSARGTVIYSVFNNNMRGFQKTVPAAQSQNILNQEEAADLAATACGAAQDRVTYANKLSGQERKGLEAQIGTEFDWIVTLKPSHDTKTAFISQERLAVICLSTLEQ